MIEELLKAISEGNLKKFIELTLDVTFLRLRDENGRTPFLLAASFGQIEIIKYIVSQDQKYELNLLYDEDNKGKTALLLAVAAEHISPDDMLSLKACQGNLEVIKFLLTNKFAKLTERDNVGFSAALIAANYGPFYIIEYLVSHPDVTEKEKGIIIGDKHYETRFQLLLKLVSQQEEQSSDLAKRLKELSLEIMDRTRADITPDDKLQSPEKERLERIVEQRTSIREDVKFSLRPALAYISSPEDEAALLRREVQKIERAVERKKLEDRKITARIEEEERAHKIKLDHAKLIKLKNAIQVELEKAIEDADIEGEDEILEIKAQIRIYLMNPTTYPTIERDSNNVMVRTLADRAKMTCEAWEILQFKNTLLSKAKDIKLEKEDDRKKLDEEVSKFLSNQKDYPTDKLDVINKLVWKIAEDTKRCCESEEFRQLLMNSQKSNKSSKSLQSVEAIESVEGESTKSIEPKEVKEHKRTYRA